MSAVVVAVVLNGLTRRDPVVARWAAISSTAPSAVSPSSSSSFGCGASLPSYVLANGFERCSESGSLSSATAALLLLLLDVCEVESRRGCKSACLSRAAHCERCTTDCRERATCSLARSTRHV